MVDGSKYESVDLLFTEILDSRSRLRAVGIDCKSSIGSTPSCSHPIKDMGQLSEVHPGNYVFYGMWSAGLGVCRVTLLDPLVS